MSPQRISSSATLLLRLLLPILWTSFFGAMTLAVVFIGEEMGGLFHSALSKLIFVGCFFVFLAVLWYLASQIYRVEVDEHFVYVYNYIKSARYPYHNIARIQRTSVLGIYRISLHEGGIFGRTIYFMPSTKKIEIASSTYPYFHEKIKASYT